MKKVRVNVHLGEATFGYGIMIYFCYTKKANVHSLCNFPSK
jgi:hypothetical protein